MFLFFCISQSQTICLKYTLSVYQKFSFQVNSITISGGRNPGKYVLKNKTFYPGLIHTKDWLSCNERCDTMKYFFYKLRSNTFTVRSHNENLEM